MPCARASAVRCAASRSTSVTTIRPTVPRTWCATQACAKDATSVLEGMAYSSGGLADANVDDQAGRVIVGSGEGAADRHGLCQIARHRHRDQVEAARLAVGGIETDPAGARHEHFRPGMGRAADTLLEWTEQIARNDPRAEAQGAGRFHEQDGKVAA